jgi:hypothetical protein
MNAFPWQIELKSSLLPFRRIVSEREEAIATQATVCYGIGEESPGVKC